MGKTINELLEEFNDPPFTYQDYLNEKARVEKIICEKYNLKPEEIEQAMREHRIPHSCHPDDIVDRWVQNEAIRPYVEEDSGDENT